MLPRPLVNLVPERPSLAVLGLVALSLVVFTFVLKRQVKKGPFPAGPKRYPLIGCMLDMPQDKQYIKFSEWKRRYGDLVGLKVLGKNMLILNSRQAVEDLLVKRGVIYSSRPPMTILTEWGGFGWGLFALEYGPEMHTQRRLMNQHMNRAAVKAFDSTVLIAALALMSRLQEDPDKFDELFSTMVGAVIIKATYGFDVKDDKDKWVVLSDRMFKSFKKITSVAAHPVDILPILARLPPRLFGRQLAEDLEGLKSDSLAALHLPFEALKKDMADGNAPFSMSKALIEDNTQVNGSIQYESSIKALAALSYSGGAETTITSLRNFLIAMMLCPDVQKKAQAIIDAVIEDDRVPSYDDRASLPYIEAILKEVHRWRPVAPLAVPHMSSEDDVYQGYHIPAGTVIFPNAWQCLHDETDYPEPDTFRPERFMDGSELAKDFTDPADFAFGFGRRICPGQHLAENILWMNIVLILYTFYISMPIDAQGTPIKPDLEFLSSPTTLYAKPFKCKIRLRSSERLELVKLAYEQLTADQV